MVTYMQGIKGILKDTDIGTVQGKDEKLPVSSFFKPNNFDEKDFVFSSDSLAQKQNWACLTLTSKLICKILLLTPEVEPAWQFCGFIAMSSIVSKLLFDFLVAQTKSSSKTLIVSVESMDLNLNLQPN